MSEGSTHMPVAWAHVPEGKPPPSATKRGFEGRGKIRTQIARLTAGLLVIVVVLSLFFSVSFVLSELKNTRAAFNREAENDLSEVGAVITAVQQQMDGMMGGWNAENYHNSSRPWDRALYASFMENNLRSAVRTMPAIRAAMLRMNFGSVLLEAHDLEETAYLTLREHIRERFERRGAQTLLVPDATGTQYDYLVMRRALSVFDRHTLRTVAAMQVFFVIDLAELLPASGFSDNLNLLLVETDHGARLVNAGSVAEAERLAEGLTSLLPEGDGRLQVGAGLSYFYRAQRIYGDLFLLSVQPLLPLYTRGFIILALCLFQVFSLTLFAFRSLRFIHRGIAEPMRSIESSMHRISDGDRACRLPISGETELDQISAGVNELLDALQRQMDIALKTQEDLNRAEILRRSSQLMALQMQINPHFLYNTLECVRSISASYGAGEVITIVNAMADIFRYNSQPGSFSTLREEVACCRSYARITSVRFRGRYSIVFHTEAEALDFPVLRMMLQPIVENAVFHGLGGKSGPGEIRVAGILEEAGALLTVRDTGCGMSDMELMELHAWLDSDTLHTDERYGIGMKNVHQRLKSEYGDAYGLRIASRQGSFTEVSIRVPKRTQEVQT